MSTKPTRMWHADKDGMCHPGCEACNAKSFDESKADRIKTYCSIARMLPWQPDALCLWGPCPFAVLSDALCAVRQHEEKPDEDRRCGTCYHNPDGYCHKVEFVGTNGDAVLLQNDGESPPWPNCRFWRKR